ncbi:MAG: hypothetical protein L7F77_08555 [Candidatus Magnetominusculus sp. LBB02]|nr:hypothetical protein [Candidatus Magnetominusculus sp. LBB02]
MSEILEVAHEMAKDLFKAGAMDEITMLKMDALCLPPKRAFLPEDIRRIRAANHVSQAVFAALLGIGKTTFSSGNRDKRSQAVRHGGFSILLSAKGFPCWAKRDDRVRQQTDRIGMCPSIPSLYPLYLKHYS